MDESGRKDAESNSPVEQQGIFSSPDLAVNSENLEEIKPELSEDNKSRIASAFRNTDASAKRRAAEAEAAADQAAQNEARWEQNISGANLTPAPGANLLAPTSIPSTATGDIRMPGTKKKSKLPLILIALVVLIAVGGGAAWFILNQGPSEKEKLLAQYDEYVAYLKDGPESLRTQKEDEQTEEPVTWFLLDFGNMNLPIADQRDYTEELLKRYNNFSGAFLNDVQSESVTSTINNYADLLNTTVKLASADVAANDLLKVYLENGAEDAYRFIENNSSTNSESTMVKTAMSSLAKYLEAQLTIIEIYDAHSCIVENALDASCEETISSTSPTYDSMLRNQDTMLRVLNQSLSSLGASLKASTDQLKTLAEASYEK